jgi:hypothetical protein
VCIPSFGIGYEEVGDVALAWVADSYTKSFPNLLWNWTNEATTTVRIPERKVDDDDCEFNDPFSLSQDGGDGRIIRDLYECNEASFPSASCFISRSVALCSQRSGIINTTPSHTCLPAAPVVDLDIHFAPESWKGWAIRGRTLREE